MLALLSCYVSAITREIPTKNFGNIAGDKVFAKIKKIKFPSLK